MEIAKLPADLLEKSEFIEAAIDSGKLSVSLLSKIALESDVDKRKIAENIMKSSLSIEDKTKYEKFFQTGLGQQYT